MPLTTMWLVGPLQKSLSAASGKDDGTSFAASGNAGATSLNPGASENAGETSLNTGASGDAGATSKNKEGASAAMVAIELSPTTGAAPSCPTPSPDRLPQAHNRQRANFDPPRMVCMGQSLDLTSALRKLMSGRIPGHSSQTRAPA